MVLENEIYDVRPGSIEFGKEYEAKMVALLALRCALQEDVWIASNVANVGALDDIIFQMTMADGRRITYMMQVKHKDDSSDMKKGELLNAGCDDSFYLRKYFKDIINIKNSLEVQKTEIISQLGEFGDIYFVLFTNRGVGQFEFLEEDTENTLSILDTNKEESRPYKCNFVELRRKGVLEGISEDCLTNFRLLTKQIHVRELNDQIEEEVVNIVRQYEVQVDERSVAKHFLNYVTDWAKGKLTTRAYCLRKQEILQKLMEFCFSQHAVDFQNEPYLFYSGRKKRIWNTIIRGKLYTHVHFDEEVFTFLKQYLGSEIRQYLDLDDDTALTWSSDLAGKIKLRFFGNNEVQLRKIIDTRKKITIIDVYKCLWFNGELPLLLQVNSVTSYTNILNITHISDNNLRIIVLCRPFFDLKYLPSDQSYFVSLCSLNKSCRNKVLNRLVKLQGKSSILLRKVIDKVSYRHIKCKEIIHILSDSFNIGYRYEPVVDYFVERSLSKVFIKPKTLTLIKNELFLIYQRNKGDWHISTCKLEDFDISNENHPNVIVTTKDLTLNKIFKLKTANKTVHRLILHNDDCLEWKETFGSTVNIRKYQLFDEHKIVNVQFNTDLLWMPLRDKIGQVNAAHVISASPGMGKSTMLDFVAQEAPVDKWVIKITLNKDEHEVHYERNIETLTAYDHLRYFNKFNYGKYNCVEDEAAESVFSNLMSSKDVLVFLDGFDEISIDNKDKVTEIVKCLHEEGYHVWITTRPIMKKHLEEALNVVSTTLKPFTEHDQKAFLIKYFSYIDSDYDGKNSQEIKTEFVKKLLDAAKRNLNDKDCEFTGIPLQTKLLADVFRADYKNAVQSGVVTPIKPFNLLDLYDEFIKEKTKIVIQKFGRHTNTRRFIKKHQQFFALQKLFGAEDLLDLNIEPQLDEYYKNVENKAELIQQDGVTVAYNAGRTETEQQFEVIFLHRTVAEYLTAKWLSQNYNSPNEKIKTTARNLIEKRFSQQYTFLFNIFDRIIAGKSNVHCSIISGQRKELEEALKSNPAAVNQVDAGGRSLLHLIALYGVHHSKASSTLMDPKDEMLEIIDTIPNNKIINAEDNILNYTPLDYAIANQSLAVANKLCQKFEETNREATIKIKITAKTTHFSHCTHFNYKYLFKVLLKHFAIQEMLEDPGHSSDLHKYAGKFGVATILELFQSKNSNSSNQYQDVRFAIAFGSMENAVQLLSKDNLNQKDFYCNTPIYYAVIHRRLDMVQMLLEKGANVNESCHNKRTALHCAVDNNYTEITKELLLRNADTNKLDNKEQTPLHLAVINGHLNIAQLLVSQGANCNLQDFEGNTVYHFAAERGYHDLLQEILKSTAAINSALNITNIFDETPLHRSVKNFVVDDDADAENQEKTVRLLLKNQTDVNLQDCCGNTALHYVSVNNLKRSFWIEDLLNSEESSKTLVEMLLLNDARVDVTNNEDKTALDLAQEDDNVQIFNLLKKHSNN